MKYIVVNQHGPLKLGGHKLDVSEIAMPAELDQASRFDTPQEAEKEAQRMLNLIAGSYRVIPLTPLDQQ